MTLGYVTKLLDDENDNIKNIKDGEFKPTKKSLSCHKDPDSVDYDVTPIMFTCRTLDNKNRVLETKNYNVIQSLNKTEQIDAENAKIASHKTKTINNSSKKRFRCVTVGESFDVYDKKPDDNNILDSVIIYVFGFGIIGIILIIAACLEKMKKI